MIFTEHKHDLRCPLDTVGNQERTFEYGLQ